MSTVTDQTSPGLHAEDNDRGRIAAQGWNGFIADAGPFADDCAAHIQCTDTEELTEQVRDWNVELDRLSPGPFAARGLMIPLNSLLVSMCTVNRSVLLRLAPPAGCLSIIVTQPGTDPFLWGGRELSDGHCAVLSGSAYAEAISHGTLVGFAVAVREDVWDAQSDWTGDSGLMENGVHATGADWTAGVREGIRWILDAATRHPENAMSSAVRASMADLMLARLRGSSATAPSKNDRRTHSRRRIAVERARSFIHGNLTRPIRLSELCAHAHLQARSLEYGFLQMVGMSPVSYIRTLRLNRARHLLLSTHRSERTITEIALDCGFWHLSQFASDYRKLFGESPSTAHRGSAGISVARRTAAAVYQ